MYVDLYQRHKDEDYLIGVMHCDEVITLKSYLVDGKIVKKIDLFKKDAVSTVLFVKAIYRITYGNYKIVLADKSF